MSTVHPVKTSAGAGEETDKTAKSRQIFLNFPSDHWCQTIASDLPLTARSQMSVFLRRETQTLPHRAYLSIPRLKRLFSDVPSRLEARQRDPLPYLLHNISYVYQFPSSQYTVYVSPRYEHTICERRYTIDVLQQTECNLPYFVATRVCTNCYIQCRYNKHEILQQ